MSKATITVSSSEAPAAGTKRPHKFTATDGVVYKTFDPAIAGILRLAGTAPVEIDFELQPGKPGYPAEPFIIMATPPASAAGTAGAATSTSPQPIPHAVGNERIAVRQTALRCAAELAAAKVIGPNRVTAAADHFTAWIYEQESGIVLMPNDPDAIAAAAAAAAPKPIGATVPLEMLTKIAAAGKAAPEAVRTQFYGTWLPGHGYTDYHTFTITGAEHAQAALEFLGAR